VPQYMHFKFCVRFGVGCSLSWSTIYGGNMKCLTQGENWVCSPAKKTFQLAITRGYVYVRYILSTDFYDKFYRLLNRSFAARFYKTRKL